jgi:hypothetical protein
LDNPLVFLIPVGAARYELYSEAHDDDAPDAAPHPADPFWRRTLHRIQAQWRETVDAAGRTRSSAGWFARVRDRAVCRTAETIAEQRTLWSLRHYDAATIVHPTDLSDGDATAVRDRLLAAARRHHGRWLAIDGVLLIVSGIFMLVPGPNVLAYYFAFRVVSHYLSWRGARQALDRTRWQQRSEPALLELGRLASEPRAARAGRVAAIAENKWLPRLAVFFDRTAIE